MNVKDYITYLLPKIIQFNAAKHGLIKPFNPITLTFIVTAACQSNCKTCRIGSKFRENPQIVEKDLKLVEIENIFKSIGHVYYFNIAGGEPFLREDLPDIIDLACKHLRPKIIHIPTNAIASKKIYDLTTQCLQIINRYNRNVPLTVKPSIDGVGDLHDEIRGVKGNFKQLEKTIGYLKNLEKKYRNLHLELGTVISNLNIHRLSEIEDYVHSLGIQSYRNEIAEYRPGFFNLGEPIIPTTETYEKLVGKFAAKIRRNIAKKRRLTKVTEAFRLVYYDLAVKIMRENRQVIPCYAGIANASISHDGMVRPCGNTGYYHPFGSLRENNFDFQRIWRSKRAKEVRKYIMNGNCNCHVASYVYTNMLCNTKYLLKVIFNILRLY